MTSGFPNVPDLRHILIVGDFAYVNGGQAKVSIDTATLLADRGLGVTFFAACGPVAEELRRPGIEVVCLDQADILNDPRRLAAAGRGIWNRTAARRLRDLAAGFDPRTTLLHCHGYAKALSPSIGPILSKGPLPSLYTMHEYFLACPNGGFYDYQAKAICTRHALGARCLSTNCDVRHPAHKAWRVARQAMTLGPGRMPRGLGDVICISDLQRQVMAPYLPETLRLHHVPNPLPSEGLERIEARGNDVFLFVGRLSSEKGAAMFAEAARRLGLRAVFVGDGPEADTIRDLYPEAEVLGWQPTEAVQRHLARARALVFPSLWYEGQPLVPLEALQRGVPVVCGSWTAAREFVEDGKNGILYDHPHVDDLVGALERVADLGGPEVGLHVDLSVARHFERLGEVYGQVMERHHA